MAYASTALANPDIQMPHVAMPKFRWPRLSPEPALLIMIMISPSFLAAPYSYCVQRCSSRRQVRRKQVPDE